MTKWGVKLVAIFMAVFILIFTVNTVIYINPYLYTKFHGNEETRKLYTLYIMGEDQVDVSEVMNFIKQHSLEYVEFKQENLIKINAESEGHGETVLIWYESGKTTSARFDDFL